MFTRYLLAKRSWIVLFLGLLGLTNLIIILDQGLNIKYPSLLYLNVLNIVLFLVFFLWRYKKETKYSKAIVKLQEVKTLDLIANLPEPISEMDKLVNDILHHNANQFKLQLSELKNLQLIENDFVAAWIHEVKTPLTSMKLILDSRINDPSIRKLETEWLRIHLLIDRQLHMTRLPVLESDYVLEHVSIQRLAAEEIRELAPWCIEKHLAVNIEGHDAVVVTDHKWCRFIIRQLLTNAIKYSPFEKVITLRTNTTSNNHMMLDIIDEGPGIKPHDLPRIYDKGFTGENGRIHNAATGLGLYLAKTVAEILGIDLCVVSSTSQGTRMRLTFSNPNAFEVMRREHPNTD